jgi:hypothetical protein
VFNPSSIKGNSIATTTSSAITVTTTAATAKVMHSPGRIYLAQWISGIGLFLSMVLIGGPKRRHAGMFGGLLLLLIVIPGCGGGGSHSSSTPPPAVSTPAGSYNVVVSATSGSTVSSTGFALVVQ